MTAGVVAIAKIFLDLGGLNMARTPLVPNPPRPVSNLPLTEIEKTENLSSIGTESASSQSKPKEAKTSQNKQKKAKASNRAS